MLYPDVSSMLAAHGMSGTEAPFEHDGYSGATMARIRHGDQSYVIKRVSRTVDWIIQMTSDHSLREAQIAASDVLAPLAPGLRSPSIAASRDGDGFALLMRDLSPHLLLGNAVLAERHADFVLRRVAEMHARFWGAPPAVDIGWCGMPERLLMLSEDAGRRLREAGLMELGFAAGWERFHAAVPPEVSALVHRLHDDPTPLVAALAALPQTLLHNDVKVANMAIEGDTLWLFDWALAGIGPVSAELGWLLAVNSSRLPWSLDDTLARYRTYLERALGASFADDDWSRQRAGTLLGGLVMFGWAKAGDPDELRWWSKGGLAGAALLGL